MKSNTAQIRGQAGNEAHQRVVVQCPSCNTRFAVASQALQGQQQPRFHCSRCDHVFLKNYDARTKQLSNLEPSHSAQLALDPSALDEKSETRPRPNLSPSRRPVQPQAALMNDDSPPQRSFNADKTEQSVKTVAAPQPEKIQPPSQLAWPFQSGKHRFNDDELANYREAPREIPVTPSTTAWREQLARAHSPRSRKTWMLIAVPIVAVLVVLALSSVYITHGGATAENFMRSILPNLAQTPPTGLHVKDLEYRRVNLASGETIHLLSGKLKNDSKQTLMRVQIEGLLFDQQGRNIARLRTDASETLAKTRTLKSLTLAMIENLQNDRLIQRLDLEPGKQQRFALAIPDQNYGNLAYYSARIHSVKY